MAGRIILVRHAMPETVRGVAPSLWRLGDPAKEDCVLLAHALPRGLAGTVYTSDEPKASETAAIIAMRLGLQVAQDARLREVDRPEEWLDDHRAAVRDYLRSGHRPGWEPPEAAGRRFAATVDQAREALPTGDLVLVNHGMALTLYAARYATLDIVAFWEGLRFPDAWALDLESAALERLFPGGLAGE